jgi:tyrosinase
MMDIDRRAVLKSGAAVALASALPATSVQAQAQPVVTRRSIGSLAANDPIVASYRKAVAAMKALPSSDRRNWRNQALIHQNSCPHGNWFFLPWHRAYLIAFERICRQLSGNASFALPYWDWSANPQIPAVFAAQNFGGQANPLFNNTRSSQTATIPNSIAGPARISQILTETSFEVFASSRPQNQNNTNASWQRRNGIQGPLESGPHNNVHGIINGDMGDFMSPLDPIFWLHHCNVDRIWDRWNRLGRANTTNTLWRNFAFNGQFFNPSGASGTTPFNVAVSGLLNINSLGYQYVVPGAPLVAAMAVPSVLAKTIDLAKPQQVTKVASVPAAQLNTPIDVVVAIPPPQTQKLQGLKTTAALTASATKPKQAPSRILAIVRDVEPPKDGNTEVRVFINCPYLSATTSPQDRHYAGSFTFFGREHADHGEKPSFLIDITETVARLQQDGLDLKDEIKVQLLPVPIPNVPTAPEVKAGSIEVAFF